MRFEFVTGGLLVLASSAVGQQVLRTHYALGDFPFTVRQVGDADGDGFPDYGISYPGTSVDLHSGRTGDVMASLPGNDIASVYSFDTIGDYDQDGSVDYIVGRQFFGPSNGAAFLYSGTDGCEIDFIPGGFAFGRSVHGLGDINLDGHQDFAVGNNTVILIYHGPDARQVRVHSTLSTDDVQMDVVGDVDGDGAPDYVVGFRSSGVENTGRVVLYSGLSGAILHDIVGEAEDLQLGASVARAGDLTGDGIPDFWAGATKIFQLMQEPGEARLYSGADGTLVSRIMATNQNLPPDFAWRDEAGSDLHGGEDVNGDGVPDLLLVARGARWDWDGLLPVLGDVEAISILSGATGQRLFEEMGDDGTGDIGRVSQQALLGDLDGDGCSEWAVAYRFPEQDNPTAWGRVTIYRGARGDAWRACSANPNSLGRRARLETPNSISPLSRATRFQALYVPAGQFGIFFYGRPAVEVPFGDGVLCVGGELFRLSGPVPAFDWNVVVHDPLLLSPELAFGPGALVAGSSWRFQCWYRDPDSISTGGAGFNLTDAMDITFVP